MATQSTTKITGWSDPEMERTILDSLSLDAAWQAVERLGSLVRLSRSEVAIRP